MNWLVFWPNGSLMLIGATAAVLLLLLGRRLAERERQILATRSATSTRRTFWSEERGSSYALGTALAVPFYLWMIATVLEFLMLVVVKVGTVYAAYCAARAAAVWLPVEMPAAECRELIHTAAAHALAPYASGRRDHELMPATLDPLADEAYYQACTSYCDEPLDRGYILRKRHYALAAIRLEIVLLPPSNPERHFEQDVQITLRYEAPIMVPGLGPLLGHRVVGSHYTTTIESTATMQLELPKSENHLLGIAHDPRFY